MPSPSTEAGSREREVGFVEQRLQRRAAAGARRTERSRCSRARRVNTSTWRASSATCTASSCTTSRKCGWTRPRKTGGHDERGLLVLDEVGHDLDDRVLDVVGSVDAASQSMAVAGSHWLRGGLGVEPGRDVGPHASRRRGRSASGGPPASTSAPRAARPHVGGRRSAAGAVGRPAPHRGRPSGFDAGCRRLVTQRHRRPCGRGRAPRREVHARAGSRPRRPRGAVARLRGRARGRPAGARPGRTPGRQGR